MEGLPPLKRHASGGGDEGSGKRLKSVDIAGCGSSGVSESSLGKKLKNVNAKALESIVGLG